MKSFTDFYFEFEDKVSKGEYTIEQASDIFAEALTKYYLEATSIEIPKEDPEGFCFYVKLLNTDIYPRKKFKLLAKKVTSIINNSSLTYTGQEDPVRYWVGPFETQKEAIQVSRQLTGGGLKSKVEKWTPKMIQNALLKEEKDARNKAIRDSNHVNTQQPQVNTPNPNSHIGNNPARADM